MASYDSYYNNALNSSAETRAADIAAAEQVYDTQAQTVTDTYKTQMADTEISYENAFKSNEVQRQLNERYIARKAAELGLTDSGMNRTQQTAVQLSYANQKGSLSAQKQKAIDTLAQAMQAKIVEIKNNKTAAVQEINSSYDAAAREQATSMYNSYQSSQAAIAKARNEQGNEWKSEFNKLLTGILDPDTAPDVKKRAIEAFGEAYGYESVEQANAVIGYAGLSGEYGGFKYVIDPDNPDKLKMEIWH